MNRSRFMWLLIFPFFFALSVKTYANEHTSAENNTSKKPNLLFVQQASNGSIVPDHKHTGCYKLKLRGLKNIIYFSDQPHRISGEFTIQQFLQVWHHNRGRYSDHPNVAIEAFYWRDGKLMELDHVAMLSNPRYREASDSITYLACPLHLSQKKLQSLQELSNVSLFFDEFHPWPP